MLPRHACSGIVLPPHVLWFFALWLFMIPARAEWRLEQRSRVDGTPPTVTAMSSTSSLGSAHSGCEGDRVPQSLNTGQPRCMATLASFASGSTHTGCETRASSGRSLCESL